MATCTGDLPSKNSLYACVEWDILSACSLLDSFSSSAFFFMAPISLNDSPACFAISRMGVHLLRRSITRLSLSFLVNVIYFNKYRIKRKLRCYHLLPGCYHCCQLVTLCYHLFPPVTRMF